MLNSTVRQEKEERGNQVLPKQLTSEWYLEEYATNMNEQVKNNLQDTIVIGREREMNSVLYALSRKSKNNPVLIGVAGAGKTAIVQGLAKKIVLGQVPDFLKNKVIYSLELANMAHEGKDGNLIYRLKKIITALTQDRNKILFLDEIHEIAGTGAKKGALDAGNVLKPALSRGEIQLIGATTIDEFHEYLEKDKALERRFETIMVNEPTAKEALKIMQGLQDSYQKFHHVMIEQNALNAAVNLSIRYDPEHNLPDKAIDLLDIACAKARFNNNKIITEKNIAYVLNEQTGIPITSILKSTSEKVLNLEKYMKQNLKGQDEAIHDIAGAIQIAEVGLQDPTRPISSFIFLGTTGVGKTYAAKTLAQVMFDSEDAIIRFDMSEYQDKSDIKRLLGSENEKGQLTEAVRRRPYSILLFDEIEKADKSLFDILLQMLDDGRITDGRGETVNCKNTVIILTTNLGAQLLEDRDDYLERNSSEKAQEIFEKQVDTELLGQFRPEFINRIDHKIVFNRLSMSSVKEIAKADILQIVARAKKQGYTIEFTDRVTDFLARKGYDRENGARPLQRKINDILNAQLSQFILRLNISNPKKINKIKIDVKGEKNSKTELKGSEKLIFTATLPNNSINK